MKKRLFWCYKKLTCGITISDLSKSKDAMALCCPVAKMGHVGKKILYFIVFFKLLLFTIRILNRIEYKIKSATFWSFFIFLLLKMTFYCEIERSTYVAGQCLLNLSALRDTAGSFPAFVNYEWDTLMIKHVNKCTKRGNGKFGLSLFSFYVLHALYSKATISLRFASCQIAGLSARHDSFTNELVNKQTSFQLQTCETINGSLTWRYVHAAARGSNQDVGVVRRIKPFVGAVDETNTPQHLQRSCAEPKPEIRNKLGGEVRPADEPPYFSDSTLREVQKGKTHQEQWVTRPRGRLSTGSSQPTQLPTIPWI